MRVFYVGLVHDDFLATLNDIRIHFLNDETKLVLVTLEDVKHKFELIQILLLEHVDAASVLGTHRVSHF